VLDFHVPDREWAFFLEDEALFDDYVEAVGWAQDYAPINREVMMDRVLGALRKSLGKFKTDKAAVNCHHNYVERERHFDADVWVTRKGAVSAREGQLGILPGSMGARSFIVRGKGVAESFCSCSHGAGRAMSRAQAKQSFTLAVHRKATAGVECHTADASRDPIPAVEGGPSPTVG
jgi:tRNA-splicing ligase RtcB